MNAEIYNNLIYDCNINIRLHNLNNEKNPGRRVFIYGNRLWNPNNAGYHFYVHSAGTSRPVKFPEYFIYHNSFSGARQFMGIMSAVEASGGMPGCYILNNIISARSAFSSVFLKMARQRLFGSFDYNWVGGKYPKDFPKYSLGRHNIYAGNRQFFKLTTMPDFKRCSDKSVMNAGKDLSQPFFINGKIVDPLPGMADDYFFDSGPSLGAVQW
jgi:hypothetical protein